MSMTNGALLMSRQQLTLDNGTTDVDTGLTQVEKDFVATDPSTVAQRVMVLPMSPVPNWDFITHGQPSFSTTTNTVHVAFTNSSGTITINVLFWDPHTAAGPVTAEDYA